MTKRRYSTLIVVLVITGAAVSCDQGPKSGHGFTLPEGSVEKGEAAFVRFQCSDCHAVSGRDDLRENTDPIMTVAIGGETTRIQTYGQLVTSVINPSHRISQRYLEEPVAIDDVSRMRNYNDVMTVSEMVDVVTFLQEQYELQPYTPTRYHHYSIR